MTDQEKIYGKDSKEWLKRWDNGDAVWSIEMGGLGPGYEQAIQITFVEMLRYLFNKNYNTTTWNDKEIWKADLKKMETYAFSNETIKKLGLSGAQWGAAMNLAIIFYKRSPVNIMNDDQVKNRHIQINKYFPS